MAKRAMMKSSKFSPEVCELVVRMVQNIGEAT